ncbi:hypothetical protein Tco_1330812 [Tanacetum coccineum]
MLERRWTNSGHVIDGGSRLGIVRWRNGGGWWRNGGGGGMVADGGGMVADGGGMVADDGGMVAEEEWWLGLVGSGCYDGGREN